jgi:hypothetical protein
MGEKTRGSNWAVNAEDFVESSVKVKGERGSLLSVVLKQLNMQIYMVFIPASDIGGGEHLVHHAGAPKFRHKWVECAFVIRGIPSLEDGGRQAEKKVMRQLGTMAIATANELGEFGLGIEIAQVDLKKVKSGGLVKCEVLND